MTASTIGFSLLVLGVLLAIGKWLRVKIELFQNLFLPSSIIAGFVGLLLGPEVLGKLNFIEGAGIFTENMLEVWGNLPGLLISVVFASLFLGNNIPNLKKVWDLAGPQITLGYVYSLGQYVIGLLLVFIFLGPVFGVDPMAGSLIEIGFVGGHGTAAGMAETFEKLGFAAGAPMAMGMATIGILGGVVIGMFLINWGVRNNKSKVIDQVHDKNAIQKKGVVKEEKRKSAGKLTTSPESIEPLSLHFAYIAMAILIGIGFLEFFKWIEASTWGAATDVFLFRYVPLFPLAMIGGIIVQMISDKKDPYHTIDKGLISRIQGFALDLLIVSALSTLNLSLIGENIIPFLTLALGGTLWTVFVFLFLSPKILRSYWFERGVGDFGQSMGVTATGLMLMKVADPDNETPALESFGYKQILFEPIMGGGLFTAASVPLIYQFGGVGVFIVLAIAMILLLLFGLFGFKK